MVEYNSIETPKVNPNKNDQQQCRLNRTNKIKGYFVAEIEERELMSERHGKYIASFDYFDKLLFYLQKLVAFLLHHLQLLLEHLYQ